jgi:hypothetical protein
LSGSTTKKVFIRRFDRESLAGFVSPQTYLRSAGVELLKPDGTHSLIPYEDIKVVSFVRDLDSKEPVPEGRLFNARPKLGGLWVRLKFRDGEISEGVLPNNLLQLENHGFTLVPPSPYGNHQKLFVPRAALVEAHVLGVIGSPLKRGKAKPESSVQIGLFDAGPTG